MVVVARKISSMSGLPTFVRLHRMHEMQTIVTYDRSVCLSVVWLNSVCGAFFAAFAKSL